MGCNPFGKLISMAFGGRGRKPSRKKRSRRARRREYSLSPPQQLTSQPMARKAIYRDDGPVVVAQPVQYTLQHQGPDNQQLHHHHQHPLPEASDILPSNHARTAAEREDGVEVAGYTAPGDVCYQSQSPEQPQAGAARAVMYRYQPSPLPSAAWGERRREYFGGEYRYCYPTPMREGIYSIATDANRLTNIFSDENPNACRIV